MNIGSSLFLIAVGAILKFAVTAHVSGVKLQTVGLILMIIGGLGLAISLYLYTRGRWWATEPRPPEPPQPPQPRPPRPPEAP
jgi:hypothetical protein